MNLDECFTLDIEDGGAWFDHPVAPLRFKIALLPQHEILGIWDEAKKVVLSYESDDNRTKTRTDYLSQMTSMAKKTIIGWSGMSPEVLKKIFPMLKVTTLGEGIGELPCTPENIEWLVKIASKLQNNIINWVFARGTDVDGYSKWKSKEEQANLP